MLKAKARRWVAVHVAVDVAATIVAWLAAYALRFHEPLATLVPVTKGVPDVERYLLLLPLQISFIFNINVNLLYHIII